MGVGEGEGVGRAGGVLVHGDERGDSPTFGVGAPHEVAGALRSHHRHVDERRRGDLTEADVEAVGEEQGVALLQVRLDGGVVGGLLLGVGQEHHDEVGPGRCVVEAQHLEASLGSLGDRGRSLTQADANVDAGLHQVEGVGVTLGAVAENCDLAAGDEGRVSVCFVVHGCHGYSFSSSGGRSVRQKPARPAEWSV